MNINEDFLTANIDRLDKVVQLLAAKVSGCAEHELIAYPVIVKKGSRLFHVAIGDAESDPGPDSDFIFPYVINAAFSLEMCLKLLLLRESGRWEQTHNLNDLYLAVSNESKALMKITFDEFVKGSSAHKNISRVLNETGKTQFSWNLDKLIAQSSTAFNDWRYAFEKPDQTGCFAGYYEIRFAILSAITSIKNK